MPYGWIITWLNYYRVDYYMVRWLRVALDATWQPSNHLGEGGWPLQPISHGGTSAQPSDAVAYSDPGGWRLSATYQTDVRLVPYQLENGKYNLISVWFHKISKRFFNDQLKHCGQYGTDGFKDGIKEIKISPSRE